jgi:hypothetical protein
MKHVLHTPHFAGLIAAWFFVCSGVIAAASAQRMQSSKTTTLSASAHAVQLTAKPVRVKLVPGKKAGNTSPDETLQSLPDSRGVYLELTGLSAVKQPGTLFHLYLDLPEDVEPKPGNAWHIGSINFYNAVPVPDAPKNKSALPITLDLTAVVRNLRSAQKLTPGSTITVMATRPPEAGSKAAIGHMALILK